MYWYILAIGTHWDAKFIQVLTSSSTHWVHSGSHIGLLLLVSRQVQVDDYHKTSWVPLPVHVICWLPTTITWNLEANLVDSPLLFFRALRHRTGPFVLKQDAWRRLDCGRASSSCKSRDCWEFHPRRAEWFSRWTADGSVNCCSCGEFLRRALATSCLLREHWNTSGPSQSRVKKSLTFHPRIAVRRIARYVSCLPKNQSEETSQASTLRTGVGGLVCRVPAGFRSR